MAVLKNKTQNQYVNVDMQIFHDKKLIDRGMITTLLSLPDGWEFSIKGMAAILPDGETAISSSLNRIEKHGYITRRQVRNIELQMMRLRLNM